jgi:hypothetical protein
VACSGFQALGHLTRNLVVHVMEPPERLDVFRIVDLLNEKQNPIASSAG